MRKLLATLILMLAFTACEFTSDLNAVATTAPQHHSHTATQHHGRWIMAHGALIPGNVLVGCGNYSQGRWSEGFYSVAWTLMRRTDMYGACDTLKPQPSRGHLIHVYSPYISEDTAYVLCGRYGSDGYWPISWDDLQDASPKTLCMDRTH